MMSVAYPPARSGFQYTEKNVTQQLRQAADVLNRVNKGQINVTIFLTLDPGVATTTVIDSRISAQTTAAFMPTTASAAAQIPTMWIVPMNGQMVVHHTNSATVDRIYNVSLVG